ncbi:MAG TPA: choice-of-anchor D domain-containing protein [Bryobacteraceae bacterium]
MAVKWTYLTPPKFGANTFNPDTMILLTDGSVLIHNAENPGPRNEWYRFTPDAQGKYESGTWSAVIHMANARQFFSSGVLSDGRVYVIGGETSDDMAVPFGGDSPLGEIFDPLTNKWSPMNKPSAFSWVSGDATGCILADGRVLLGSLNSGRTALWDPATDSWVEAGLGFSPGAPSSKSGSCNEETWALLHDGTVMAIDISNNPQTTEIYNPATDLWTLTPSHPPNLALLSVTDNSVSPAITATVNEVGPAVLLHDGRLFAIGGSGHTGIYTPGVGWSAGPDFPADSSASPLAPLMTVNDAPGCLLPSGKVLCVAGNTRREALSFWSNPTTVLEYDPVTNLLKKLPAAQQPANGTDDTWTARMLLLPTGQVLFGSMSINSLAIFTPDPGDPAPKAAWKPVITGFTPVMALGHHYTFAGRQINGLSQACSYGDDAQMATNYPIVKLAHAGSGTVVYARTHSFSTMGIAPGPAIHTAIMNIPPTMPTGAYHMTVIANGIPSAAVTVTILAAAPAIVVNLEDGLEFGTICQRPKYLELTVFNVGGVDLIVNSVQRLNGSNTFHVLPNPITPVTIAPGDEVDFTIAFVPTTRGAPESATIRIASNDPVRPNVDLTATGMLGSGRLEIAIAGHGSFGDVCVGSFREEEMILNNNGPCPLSIRNIVSSSADFIPPTVLTYPLIVGAGDSIEIPIRFKPTAFGSKSATITISSDDPAGDRTVAVSGVARAPKLAWMMADSGSFGDACVGSFKDEVLTLCNSGRCTLTVASITSTSGEFIVPNVVSYPLTIEAGGSLEAPVRFQPASFGPKSATLTVVSDDPGGPATVMVSGNAPSGTLAVTGSTWFGEVPCGREREKTVSICNAGKCDLHVTSVAFKRKRKHFRLINNPFPATVRPGSCLGVVIQYRGSCDPECCELVIASDDPKTPVKTLDVVAYTRCKGCDKCCEKRDKCCDEDRDREREEDEEER